MKLRISNKISVSVNEIKLVALFIFLLFISLAAGIFSIQYMSSLSAFSCLIVILFTVWNSRKNYMCLTLSLVIGYFTYSFCYMYYLMGQSYLDPYVAGMNQEYELKAIAIISVYIFLCFLFWAVTDNGFEKTDYLKLVQGKRINEYIVPYTWLLLIYIALFKINRGRGGAYQVAITPWYEYSYLLILLGLFCSKRKLYHVITTILALFICLQDLFYGGRITTLQVLLVLVIFYGRKRISLSSSLICGVAGFVSLGLVGVYRYSYSTTDIVKNFVREMRGTGFSLNTAYYAYNGSLKHLMSLSHFNITDRLKSLTQTMLDVVGIKNVFPQHEINEMTWSVGISTMGGGIMPVQFYFWGGFIGVILLSAFVCAVIRKVRRGIDRTNNPLLVLAFFCICITVPRWYLYNPLLFFRPALFFLPIIWMMMKIYHAIVYRRGLLIISKKEIRK